MFVHNFLLQVIFQTPLSANLAVTRGGYWKEICMGKRHKSNYNGAQVVIVDDGLVRGTEANADCQGGCAGHNHLAGQKEVEFENSRSREL